MSWTTISSAVNDDLVEALGETVTLPAGEVEAVVDLEIGRSVLGERGRRTGSELDVRHQVRPEILVRTADAEGLKEKDTVTIRGADYTVMRLEPDGTGMTRIELMLPPVSPATADGWRAWR